MWDHSCTSNIIDYYSTLLVVCVCVRVVCVYVRGLHVPVYVCVRGVHVPVYVFVRVCVCV